MKRKGFIVKRKVGDRVLVATPDYEYHCIIYKVAKPKFRGLKASLVYFDDFITHSKEKR